MSRPKPDREAQRRDRFLHTLYRNVAHSHRWATYTVRYCAQRGENIGDEERLRILRAFLSGEREAAAEHRARRAMTRYHRRARP
jgi:hypothetical protein